MQRHRRTLTLLLAAATLSACTITLRPPGSVPYRAPAPTQPSVQLTAVPLERTGKGHAEYLVRHDVQCDGDGRASSEKVALAVWFADQKEYKTTVVAVPAGRVYFKYERYAPHASCSLDFSALLAAGDAYTIRSERKITVFAKWPQCELTMVDSRGMPVPLVRESADEDFSWECRKRSAEARKAAP